MKLTILGRKVCVKIIAQKKLAAICGDPEVVGLFCPSSMRIYLAKELKEKQRKLVLIHEATHCMHYITGIDQTLEPALIEVLCQTNAALFDDLSR
jgi:beta-lactamase regulating signal transducer with metallopeptidase domain